MKIKKIKKLWWYKWFNRYVYNIEVNSEDNHNYIANGINVANCHYTGAKSIQNVILKVDENLKMKYGMSGTINVKEREIYLHTQSYLGPIIQNIEPRELIDGGFLPDINFNVYKLDYLSEGHKEKLRDVRIQNAGDGSASLLLERNVIRNSKIRFDFITDKILNAKNNSLVLFSDIKNGYGKRIYEYLKVHSDKRVHYIDGGTNKKIRNHYKKIMESNDTILVASYGTLSTGISIRNIHNVFLVESYKSRTIVMQSLGRGLRKFLDKVHVEIYDFIDDFRLKDGRNKLNYVWRHGEERLGYYKQYYLNEDKSNLTVHKVKLDRLEKPIQNIKSNSLF